MLGGGGPTGGYWRRLCLGCEWNGSGGHYGKVSLVLLGPSSPSLRELTPYSIHQGWGTPDSVQGLVSCHAEGGPAALSPGGSPGQYQGPLMWK